MLSRITSGSRTVSTTICASERASSILSKSIFMRNFSSRTRFPDGQNALRPVNNDVNSCSTLPPTGGSADNVLLVAPEVSQAPTPKQWLATAETNI
jgi:hypothetical protein